MKNSKQNRLLIIGFTWPEPKSSAAGSRMMQLIALFKTQDWEITFASPAQQNPHSVNLETCGISTAKINPNTSEVAAFFKKTNPDIVLFDRFMMEEQFGWRVAETCPNALRILDTEDLHFLRKAREKAFRENRNFNKTDLYSEVAKREIASILRCDFSLIISEAERALLIEKFNLSPDLLWYLPFLTEKINNGSFAEFPTFEERQNSVFIGNFLHPPNVDAVLFLKKEIWPLVRQKLPEAELHIYGAYVPQKIKHLENAKENFFVKGRTENLEDIMQNARILLAPLRFGAGLKGKFIDAMQNGTPCVTTTIGTEGISGKLPFSGEIANSPERIADAVFQLYSRKKQWQKAQQHGRNIINSRFEKTQFEKPFFEKLINWQKNLKTQRENNFLGQMLMHHRQQSTKYMARWIEAKNNTN